MSSRPFLNQSLAHFDDEDTGREASDRHSAQRARMVAEIAAIARETASATGRSSFNGAVMTAMGKVPRHRFVPPRQQAFAYENRALPIGEGQTISSPSLSP